MSTNNEYEESMKKLVDFYKGILAEEKIRNAEILAKEAKAYYKEKTSVKQQYYAAQQWMDPSNYVYHPAPIPYYTHPPMATIASQFKPPVDLLQSPLGRGFFYKYDRGKSAQGASGAFCHNGFAIVPKGVTVNPLSIIHKISTEQIVFTPAVTTKHLWYVDYYSVLVPPESLVYDSTTVIKLTSDILYDIFSRDMDLIVVLLSESVKRPNTPYEDIGFLVSMKDLIPYSG
jgi:hypothetical protein